MQNPTPKTAKQTTVTATNADGKRITDTPNAKPKAKPAPKPAPTVAEQAAKQAAQAAVTTSRGLARDAATVTAQATFYKQYSDRDTAYLAFFGSVMRANGGKATLAQIHEAGADAGKNKKRNPRYAGSAKATDAGAINRLIKAGYITASADGSTLTATKAATTTAAYNGKA